MTITLSESLHRFTEATSLEAIDKLLREQADALGYGTFIYALRVPTTFAGVGSFARVRGCPKDWLDRYGERNHDAVDPVLAHCTANVTPAVWATLTARASPAARAMMDEARDFGLREGVSMPIHGSHGELGILSFARDCPARSGMEVDRALVATQLLGAHVHEAVRRVAGLDHAPVQLSARERECLRWAADGKTSWEISKIVQIAERTVNFHFDNAVTKLGASNRQHAIAKAIALRIVGPHPYQDTCDK